MKQTIRLASMAVAFVAAAPAFAQASATQSTTGTTTIIRPITLAKTSDIAFGRIVRPGSTTSTISIDATTGARSSTGGDAVLLSSSPTRAAYTVGGEGGQAFSISVPTSFNMTRSGGTETIAVPLAGTAASGTLDGSLGGSGTASFGVGGSFEVGTSTATGSYSGTFSVTVSYN